MNQVAKKTMSDIIAYYDQTRWDYGLLWFDQKSRAVHFGYYDDHAKSHTAALANLNRVLAETAQIKADERVLDAGCGQGGSSVWLAENIGAHAVGITPVESQVRLAQEFVSSRGQEDKVQVQIGDYTRTGFADASFDVVWACESLCHADHKEDFYREAYRLLKPGGRLIVAEYIRAEDAFHPDAERLLGEWLSGWAINAIDTRQQHLEHATRSGFSAIQIQDVTRHTEPSLRVLHRLSIILRPVEYFFRFLRIRTPYQHSNLIGSIRQYEALEKGYWFYGIISARKN